ncbi:MAG: aldose 1-epimerase family protein [Nakamurella sp.]
MNDHDVVGDPVSGRQFTISGAGYVAHLASIGATLRVLQHRGRDLVVPFSAHSIRPNYRGATLAPWPNRIVDGVYHHDGDRHRLALTEPDRGHALHGLVSWLEFLPRSVTADTVALGAVIEPQAGYPFRLDLQVTFRITDQGLHTEVAARNTGPDPAPFGTGPHPYLLAGQSPLDDWTLDLPAAEVMTVTPDRLIPIGIENVATANDGAFDFRGGRRIGRTQIDHAFTTLARDPAGRTTVRVLDPAGSGVHLSFGTECGWVQIHTADLPDPGSSRLGLAVEPMTCPPDAFNSRIDLITIQPGATSTTSWLLGAG